MKYTILIRLTDPFTLSTSYAKYLDNFHFENENGNGSSFSKVYMKRSNNN